MDYIDIFSKYMVETISPNEPCSHAIDPEPWLIYLMAECTFFGNWYKIYKLLNLDKPIQYGYPFTMVACRCPALIYTATAW